MPKFLAIALLFLGLLALSLQSYPPAQAQAGLESRVSRLETELIGIQSRLSQLGSGLQSQSIAVPAPAPPSGNQRVASTDPQFNRLATLVIELKERVTTLETHFNALEHRQESPKRSTK